MLIASVSNGVICEPSSDYLIDGVVVAVQWHWLHCKMIYCSQ